MTQNIWVAMRAFTFATAALLAALVAQNASSRETSPEQRNRELVARSFDAWRDGTGGPYDLLAEDAEWTITGNSLAAKLYPDKETFMREVIRPFNARMRSRLVPTVRRIYAEGDTVIVFFDAEGTARDGETYANTYAWILEIKGGRIVKAHAFFDSIVFDALWRRVSPAAIE